MRAFVWRGIVRPNRPLKAVEVNPRRAAADPRRDANRALCREYYAALRAAGLCVKCKGDAGKRSECLRCRRKRLGYV